MRVLRRTENTEYPIGSVITDTLKLADLIVAFATQLDWHPPLTREQRRRLTSISRKFARKDISPYIASDEAVDDLQWLQEQLHDKAGPYMYFGAHPGNDSDFGYWLDPEWEERLREDGGVIVANHWGEAPKDHLGPIAVVNDHGNVSMYTAKRDVRGTTYIQEEWSNV